MVITRCEGQAMFWPGSLALPRANATLKTTKTAITATCIATSHRPGRTNSIRRDRTARPILVACKGSFATSDALGDVDVTPANGAWTIVVAGDVGHQLAA